MRELTEDIIIGTTWGAVWGLFLAWGSNSLLSQVGEVTETFEYFTTSSASLFIGAILGFLFALRASVVYGGRSGIFDETKVYGEAALHITLTVSVVIGIMAGAFSHGPVGAIIGGLTGIVVGVGIGLSLSFICISLVALAVGAFFHIPFTALHYLWIHLALAHNQREALQHYETAGKFERNNRIQDAIAEFQKAVQLEPEFPEAHLNLGIDYGLTGRTSDEIDQYEKALKLRPNYAKAVTNLSISYAEQGNETKARNLVASKEHVLSRRQIEKIKNNLDKFIAGK